MQCAVQVDESIDVSRKPTEEKEEMKELQAWALACAWVAGGRRSWDAWRSDFAQFLDKEMENFLNFSLVQLGLSCVQVVNCFLE